MIRSSTTRVLFWAELFWPYVGGAELFGLRLIEALQAHGYQFTVLTSHQNCELPDHENYRGIEIYRMPFREALRENRIETLITICRRIEKLKQTVQPNLVHINGIHASGWFHLRTASIQAAPALLRIGLQLLPNAQAAEKSLSFTMLRAANQICCVSSTVAAEMLACLPELQDRISVVRNGIIPPALTKPLSFQPPRLLCLGRLVRNKGFDLAVAALRKVVDQYPDVRMIIAGDGPERTSLARQVEELSLAHAVEFLGLVEPRKTGELIEQAAIVVLPSRREGLPNVAIEAAALARPVVAAHVAGLPEIVQHGETGLIVEPEDPQALARQIMHLLAQPDLAKRMGGAARRRVAEKFNWQTCVSAYDALYRKMLAAPGVSTA